jgi:hypothetical protein
MADSVHVPETFVSLLILSAVKLRGIHALLLGFLMSNEDEDW